MEGVASLETALGAELLRTKLLKATRPKLAKRYVVQGVLGRGAMGLVVSATDERLGRTVALKLAPSGADPMMLAEARALARVDHPNVVRVYDVLVVSEVIDKKPFRLWCVAMQLVEGRTLRAWLRDARRSEAEIVRVFVGAGNGLAAAHAEKIVHRDFKPDNVIVRTDGVVQVLDFGFAVGAASTLVDGGALQSKVAGTDPYMAPEARLARATRRSDQFSFGVSLVEALTGSPTPASGPAPSDVSEELWAVLVRATDANKDERFPSMSELLEALNTLPEEPRRRSRFPLLLLTLLGAYWCARHPAATSQALDDGRSAVAAFSVFITSQFEGHHPDDSTSVVEPPDEGAGERLAFDVISPDTPSEDAGVADRSDACTCPPIDGLFHLRTERTRGGGARFGFYDASFVESEQGTLRLTLEKLGSGNGRNAHTHSPSEGLLAVQSVERGADCAVVVHAHREAVDCDYVFELRVDGAQVSGSFTSRGNLETGPVDGTVETYSPGP